MTQEPTLRHGDQSVDGWVEHLQKQLKTRGYAVEPTGTFDDATFDAVVHFQQANGAVADGVVGDQTWAMLRHGEAVMAGTDGREPGTYVEDTLEARWWSETGNNKIEGDELRVYASNVGSTAFDATTLPFADAVLTTPDGAEVPVQLVGRNWDGHSTAEPGQNFYFVGTNLGEIPRGTYKIVATLAAELSGDRTESSFTLE